jgi:hypothetical protein
MSKGEASPAGPLRTAIWADTTDDQRSGFRALEAQWEARAVAASTASQVLGQETSGQPDLSSWAIWWLRRIRARPAGSAAGLRPRKRALHPCHRELTTLWILLLLSQQAHEHLGPSAAQRSPAQTFFLNGGSPRYNTHSSRTLSSTHAIRCLGKPD